MALVFDELLLQGDSGHAQASMVTDQYSHILDENRQENAKLLEKAFYNGRGAEPEAEVKRKQIAMVDQMNAMGFDPLQLAKVLSNPDMVKMLQRHKKEPPVTICDEERGRSPLCKRVRNHMTEANKGERR